MDRQDSEHIPDMDILDDFFRSPDDAVLLRKAGQVSHIQFLAGGGAAHILTDNAGIHIDQHQRGAKAKDRQQGSQREEVFPAQEFEKNHDRQKYAQLPSSEYPPRRHS